MSAPTAGAGERRCAEPSATLRTTLPVPRRIDVGSGQLRRTLEEATGCTPRAWAAREKIASDVRGVGPKPMTRKL